MLVTRFQACSGGFILCLQPWAGKCGEGGGRRVRRNLLRGCVGRRGGSRQATGAWGVVGSGGVYEGGVVGRGLVIWRGGTKPGCCSELGDLGRDGCMGGPPGGLVGFVKVVLGGVDGPPI